MRRVTTQGGRAPVTGPAAWFVRFAGANSVVCPLGFGGFTIPAIVSVAQGRGILYAFGNPTYGHGPFERIGVPTTVPLLLAFLAACLVQLAGGLLLIWLRPSGFVVVSVGMLLSAPFWWGSISRSRGSARPWCFRSWLRRGPCTGKPHVIRARAADPQRKSLSS